MLLIAAGTKITGAFDVVQFIDFGFFKFMVFEIIA